ncbi:RNA-binding motif protein 25 isoform X2 [Mercurialis annua]|nr:RNA-binding motif protein 25 isoform X2 [Mercurialis annua]XP_055959629.1 RNA-binding motif protein 25 isoform X2 [Mercurialis annua]XP_055959630.1 RNA-binding motif protein 25 isoform X2 [Mercurialis annua]
MVRPMFPRPPGAPGILPTVSRPLVPGIPGVRPIIFPIIRPAVPSITPAEKPQTTVYIGKISPSVDNDFMLSLLRFCGPVKSWKRAQDPTDGTPRGFGFCEFESAEGVLRALRLLSKFNIDGQELVLNVNQATREYLERYVEKKTENSKNMKESQAAGADKGNGIAPVVKKSEAFTSSGEDSNNDGDKGNKDNNNPANFGIVTGEDKEGDKEALEKLNSMIEERLKTNPLPPPPPKTPAHASGTNSDLAAKSRDGDSDTETATQDEAEVKNDDETISDNIQATEQDKPETSSPDRSRKYDRRSRERDRERDVKREKEREIERYEREAERERVRKEREQRRKIEDAEREYEERLKDWEYREREKEKQRQYEKEKDKERDRKRRKEILYDEEGDDDDSRKRWRRSTLDDKRRKRHREKEDDVVDRLKEEDEIAEAKRRAEEEKIQQQQIDALKLLSDQAQVMNGNVMKVVNEEEANIESKDKAFEQDHEGDSGDDVLQNGTADESTMTSMAESDIQQSGNAPARKLGFGLVGSGKRTAVLSVFHEEDDDDAHKDKKMKPLVPIDYSTEELQAVQPAVSGAEPPNLAAAAEFAKRISNVTPKEQKLDMERERSRRSHDKSSHRDRDRDRDRNDDDAKRIRDDKDKIPERDRSRVHEKAKTPDKLNILDAKQLIDMIPKTKDELFSHEINWVVYDKHKLHEKMRPWISKKIVEFLGEEETTLVDYIVSSIQEHVKAAQMLEMLQSILDDEAEMFVLKMWRMLIFEIKRVENGLALKSRS